VSSRPVSPKTSFAPALNAAYRCLIAAMMTKVAGCGFGDMTPAFAALIPLLDPGGAGARATDLAQRSGVSKQAMSKLVRELQTRGYVEQASDPADTRAKIVRLTKRGIALRTACAGCQHEIIAAALRALGATRLKRLERDLTDLATALGAVR